MYAHLLSEIEMPQLVGVQTMKGGKIAASEQEIDRGRGCARSVKSAAQRLVWQDQTSAVGLPVRTAFGVWFERQASDPVRCVLLGHERTRVEDSVTAGSFCPPSAGKTKCVQFRSPFSCSEEASNALFEHYTSLLPSCRFRLALEQLQRFVDGLMGE